LDVLKIDIGTIYLFKVQTDEIHQKHEHLQIIVLLKVIKCSIFIAKDWKMFKTRFHINILYLELERTQVPGGGPKQVRYSGL